MGPQAQGAFSRIKSEIEFVTSIALFGMPSAVLYFVAIRRLSNKSAFKISAFIALISAILATSYLLLTETTSALYCILFSLVCAVYVLHSMLRVLLLSNSTSINFNISTALPQVLLFLLVAAALFFVSFNQGIIALLFLTAFLAGTLFTAWLLHRSIILPAVRESSEANIREMVIYGAATAIGTTLNSAATLLWIRHTNASIGLTAVGVLTMGLTFVQATVTPINYAAPLLVKRWLELPHQPKILPAIVAGIVTFTVLAIAVQCERFLPASISRGSYGALFDLKWSFVLIAVAEVTLRVPLSAVYAAGRPWYFPLGEATRLAALGVALLVGTHSILSITWAWAISAGLATIVLMLSIIWLDPKRQLSNRRNSWLF